MARNERHIAEENQVLCETCGYILEGLPEEGNCPECGHAVVESTDPSMRRPPRWETHPGPASFLATSAHALFRPSHFFRHLETRRRTRLSLLFAMIWLAVASLLLSYASIVHFVRLVPPAGPGALLELMAKALPIAGFPVIFLAILLVSHIAARLTAWEAAYRGYRLPLAVVQRGLQYHSVHLLPASVLVWGTIYGYEQLLLKGNVAAMSQVTYLWVLSAEVVACAAYLFFTYWAAMRNILFANR